MYRVGIQRVLAIERLRDFREDDLDGRQLLPADAELLEDILAQLSGMASQEGAQ